MPHLYDFHAWFWNRWCGGKKGAKWGRLNQVGFHIDCAIIAVTQILKHHSRGGHRMERHFFGMLGQQLSYLPLVFMEALLRGKDR